MTDENVLALWRTFAVQFADIETAALAFAREIERLAKPPFMPLLLLPRAGLMS